MSCFALLSGCADPDGRTLSSVFGPTDRFVDARIDATEADAMDATVGTDATMDATDDADTGDVAVDADSVDTVAVDALMIPDGACAIVEVVAPDGTTRRADGVRCEYAVQGWRDRPMDRYFTVVVESEVTRNDDLFVRDLAQVVLDDLPADVPVGPASYDLTLFVDDASENGALYSPDSATLALSTSSLAPRGRLTLDDEAGSEGSFDFAASDAGGLEWTVRGRFVAQPAVGTLPEPSF